MICKYSCKELANRHHLGVTVVQYRDKTSDTGDQIATARQLHQICQKYGVPLLINDRVDVALAIGAEGVHLGQDDMSRFLFLLFLFPPLPLADRICVTRFKPLTYNIRIHRSEETTPQRFHYRYQCLNT